MQTSRGYLGLAPLPARQGDEVWVFSGGRVPCVLRRVVDGTGKSRRWFIGETYVHGVMNGEVMEGNEFTPVDIE